MSRGFLFFHFGVIDFFLQMWHHCHGLCKWHGFGKDMVVSTNGKLATCFLNNRHVTISIINKMSSEYKKKVTPTCMLELGTLGKEWERVQWQMFPQVCETPIIAYHFTPYEGGSKCWFTLWSKDQRTISPRTRSWTPLLYPNLGIRFLKFEEIIINELMKNAAL